MVARISKARLEAFSDGVIVAFVAPAVLLAFHAVVAGLWMLPERRIVHLADGERRNPS